MPRYVVIMNHPPSSCPSANRNLREIGNNLGTEAPKAMEKYKIKAEALFHLDPGHKVLWVLEAPSAETVRDFLYDAGLLRWNDFEFYMANSLDDVTSRIQHQPTIW